MNVKVCGITTEHDARMVLDAGADAVGVVVDVPVETPRKISVSKAAEIRESLSDISHAFVAVIMPETVEDAVRVCAKVKPDGVQLHGAESAGFVRELRGRVDCHIIKAIHIGGDVDMDYVVGVAGYADMLLLDTKVGGKVGGTGVTHDYTVDNEVKDVAGKRIILSGGLNSENVADAVGKVKPYAVDVSSGVESKPGVKDPDKVRRFIGVTACL